MSDADLVEISKINSTILFDMRYASTNNFTGKVIYTRRGTALKLDSVQKELDTLKLKLLIFDAYRPKSAQYKLWEIVPDDKYVADPNKGSVHNRGAAVDLTIVKADSGIELEMPTPFDDFTVKAHRDCMDLPPQAIQNRKLLEDVMERHGFKGYKYEWWHFDDVDSSKYDLIDIPFEEIN